MAYRSIKVQLGAAMLETPNFIASTRKGSVPHLLPNLVDHNAVAIYFDQMIDYFQNTGIFKEKQFKSNKKRLFAEESPESARKSPISIHEITGNLSKMVFLIPKFIENAEQIVGEDYVTAATDMGNRRLSLDSYLQIVMATRPDAVVCLSDASLGSENRLLKGLKRNLEWIERHLAAKKQLEAETGHKMKVFSPIHFSLGLSTCQSILDSQITSKVDGFVFDASLGFVDELALLRRQPETAVLPRFALKAASLDQILLLVEAGVDLFDSAWITEMTEKGLALNFSVKENSQSFLDLKDKSISCDLNPLNDECQCHCCGSYSRAYLHHLISCGEMLGSVLLQLHNLHGFGEFLGLVRRSISSGNFLEFKENFLKARK